MGLMWLSIRSVGFQSPQLMLHFRTKMPFSIFEKIRSWPKLLQISRNYSTIIVANKKCPVNFGKFIH